MRLWWLACSIETLVFVSVGLFIWFRPNAGAGVVNTMTNKPVSIGIWIALFLCIYIGNLVWLILIKKGTIKKDR